MENGRALTPRQEEIVRLAADGYTDKEISVQIGLSVGTLRTHWDRIRARTGAASRGAVIAELMNARSAELTAEIEVLRRALAETGVFVWTARPDGHVDYVSPAFAQFGGMTSQEMVGPGCRALMIDSELRESADRWRRAQDTGRGYGAKVRFRSGCGQLVAYQIRLTPVGAGEGRDVSRWLGVAQRATL